MKPDITTRQNREAAPESGAAASEQLRSVIAATEAAANAIMQCAETVMGAAFSDLKTYRRVVEEQMLLILEACAFQDVTGQQVARVIDMLHALESQPARAEPAHVCENTRRKHALLLHGPQPAGHGNSQAEIDLLLAANETQS
jgi:chemotaxis protein CheZ